MTGADTYDLIKQARDGSAEAWTTLLRYNEDDTRATRALREWLRTLE
ncbi:ribonuclease H-like domain-containing protein [Nocardioides sp. PD653]|nr:ribonuclease H-like domain-containing protein [Nocardioides sp. PD653]